MSSARSSQPALRSRPPEFGSLRNVQPSAGRSLCCVHRPMAGARLCFLALLLAFTLAGCTDVRPTTKIGLIAPFEGLYRRTGYDALAAVRAAIADATRDGTQPGAVAVLPLALDDSNDPAQAQRALEKMLVSTDVGVIIGPLTPALAAAVTDLQDAATPPIIAPFALPGAEQGAAGWATPLVQQVGALAARHGAQALVLAGWTPGWPDYTAAQWAAVAGLPVRVHDDPAAVAGGEAVLWLGAADSGAAYLSALRAQQPDAEFWLGPAGDDPVFAERAATRQRVYWVVWVDDDYNAWAATHSPSTPSAYLVYQAAQAALRKIDEQGYAALPSPTWRVQAYTFGASGEPLPYQPAP
jgi:ABC-type branched-subunit amino acid transport system substrate-binding protein